ncbi:glycerophosphodiester phosphodiesterase [Kineobactrum sediminis]|uniref:glycerophosphodiester phosphodiesterase n=1 Tax=Kineobactrum sediminis TaxID=1905677 RepID=A0A2N5Y589_9GAMM|nr:glycerophosphodiester phosphodiesterase [Kineobactrum sediminis]PLW83566.1 glycerophosphodiester phosphodiesterase [Kineobactrum sediminis]
MLISRLRTIWIAVTISTLAAMNSAASSPIVIAHRGASGYLPEHTLAAKAMAHGMGADYIEQDVVLTADGVPIVLHDIHLDTTTDVADLFPGRARDDGRFYAIDFSLEEVRRLRVHERSDTQGQAVFPQRFPLGPGLLGVPTLAEEIDLIAGMDRSRQRRTGLYIELKAPRFHQAEGQDIARRILEVLALKGYAERSDQVFLQCFDDQALRYLRHTLETPLPLIQLIADPSWGEDSAVDYEFLQSPAGLDTIAEYADGIGPWLMQIYLGKTDAGAVRLSTLVADAHARGLQVHPYTFRRDQLPPGIADFDELLDVFFQQARVDGLFTDFPDLARDYLLQNPVIRP